MDRNFKRIVLKLSGEALAGKQGYGIDPKTVDLIARDIATVTKQGIQVAIVVGRLYGYVGNSYEFSGPSGCFGKARYSHTRSDSY